MKAELPRSPSITGVVRLVAGQTMEVDDEVDSISHCRLDMPMQRAVIFNDLTGGARSKRRSESSHYNESAAKIISRRSGSMSNQGVKCRGSITHRVVLHPVLVL
jgi:hypothetical protein